MGGFPQEVNYEAEISIQIIRQGSKIICLWKGRDVAVGLGRINSGWIYVQEVFLNECLEH